MLIKELEYLDRNALPATAIYDPKTKKWNFLPEVFSTKEVIEAIDKYKK